jgi:hypothetical protein
MEVLDRYPHLRVIFAHFFFIAPQLDRAAQLLERYPNVYLDLTPGIEMYFAFTRQRQRAREFFCQYSDRILLGSYSSFTRSPIPVITMIRRFLETEDTFDPPHTDPYMWPDDRAPIQGLGLSMEVVDRIYWSNPLELLGRKPRPLQEKAARDEIRRLAAIEGSHGLARTVLRRWDSQ